MLNLEWLDVPAWPLSPLPVHPGSGSNKAKNYQSLTGRPHSLPPFWFQLFFCRVLKGQPSVQVYYSCINSVSTLQCVVHLDFATLWPQISIYGQEKRSLEWKMWVKVTLGTTQSHLDLKLLLWGLEDQVSGWSRRSESQSGGVKKNQHNTSQNNTRTRSWLGILIFVSVVSGGMANIAWHCFSQIFVKNWPQVLQKNIGVFSLRSQLAQEGNSSEEDSTWWVGNCLF